MKLQARDFVARKPGTVDITAFFKKFCIATRTKYKARKQMLSSLFYYASLPHIATKNSRPLLRARGFHFQNGKPMGVSLLIASLVAFSLCVIASLTAATIIS